MSLNIVSVLFMPTIIFPCLNSNLNYIIFLNGALLTVLISMLANARMYRITVKNKF